MLVYKICFINTRSYDAKQHVKIYRKTWLHILGYFNIIKPANNK